MFYKFDDNFEGTKIQNDFMIDKYLCIKIMLMSLKKIQKMFLQANCKYFYNFYWNKKRNFVVPTKGLNERLVSR